jgi:hypothetical protein
MCKARFDDGLYNNLILKFALLAVGVADQVYGFPAFDPRTTISSTGETCSRL